MRRETSEASTESLICAQSIVGRSSSEKTAKRERIGVLKLRLRSRTSIRLQGLAYKKRCDCSHLLMICPRCGGSLVLPKRPHRKRNIIVRRSYADAALTAIGRRSAYVSG